MLLDELKGVNVPTASAILALVFPEKYGVVDIRAWNTLKRLGLVKSPEKKRKRHFDVNDWYRYIQIIRYLAKKFRTTPRKIDLVLWWLDREGTQDIIYE